MFRFVVARVVVAIFGLVLVSGISLAQTPKAATKAKKDPTGAFFNEDSVLYLAIELGPKELDALRRDARKYVSATLLEGDKDTKFGKTPKEDQGVKATFTDVAIHLKGAAGSFRQIDDKPGLTLNMDKLVEDQRFHGLDKFHLSNSVQDPSYLAELVCGEIFRAAGVPASRIRPAVVTVQGRLRGMYYLKEGYDKIFLRRNFDNRHGNLYDGGFLRDIDQPLQLIGGTDDVPDRGDLKKLLAACREPDLKKRFVAMEKILDLEEFVSYLACEVITWDWDGYPMNRNNYRIYHEPTKDKIIFIPSGMDQMYGDPRGPAVPGFNGMVARSLIETPDGRARYIARLREIMKDKYRPDDLVKTLDKWEPAVKTALATFDQGQANGYKGQVDRLRNGIRERQKSINEQLSKMK